jgi:hypothetical protein
MLGFTEYFPDPETKCKLGWSMIAFMIAHWAVNMFSICYMLYQMLYMLHVKYWPYVKKFLIWLWNKIKIPFIWLWNKLKLLWGWIKKQWVRFIIWLKSLCKKSPPKEKPKPKPKKIKQ